MAETPYRFDHDTFAAEVSERFGHLTDGEESGITVSVAGRIMLSRPQGRLAFAELRDSSGAIQLFALAKVAENASSKKSSKSSTGSAEKAEPVADAVVIAAPAAEAKPKRVLTPEHKAKMLAAAAAAREVKKAAKAAEAAPAPVVVASAPASAPAAAPSVTPVKAKKAVAAAPSAPLKVQKPLDLNFSPWTHEETEYIKNERGDVLTFPEAEWVGRFDGKKIDESVARPDDIDEYLE
jgi:hypothetical protein